ncbi:retinoic acid receptor responder protein 2-like [Leptodactylus fuscus]|uniref:retinoic acid receptor responder protein 2-like n=1 Tax=Leptodactylus fuscus TaxID=238119 RepID=UPI003F4E4CCA
MKTAAIAWGIVSALLVVSTESQSTTEELSEIQNKALKMIMEYFHKKDHIKNGFKVTELKKAIEIDYRTGIFVNLEFALKQTICHKNLWSKPDCELVKNGRTFNCFGCYKFYYDSHKVLSQLIECVREHQVDQRRTENRNRSCKEVELKQGELKPGTYGFLTSQ